MQHVFISWLFTLQQWFTGIITSLVPQIVVGGKIYILVILRT